jgi:hypothetical protein
MQTKHKKIKVIASALALACLFVFSLPCSWADWLKIDSPPDVDKKPPAGPTCWVATAANMLAGAGYGIGITDQNRADYIYNCLLRDPCIGPGTSGWVDTALLHWINDSNDNLQKGTNMYRTVTVYCDPNNLPWPDPNGARFIGNELRQCHFVGLHIRRGPNDPDFGHAITAWGDNGYTNYLKTNPAQVKVTDSDRDGNGADPNVQTYTYDDYYNPNPTGPNSGPGWYIDYWPAGNHPFISRVVTLSPPSVSLTIEKWLPTMEFVEIKEPLTELPPPPSSSTHSLSFLGSYRKLQSGGTSLTENAVELHYEVNSIGGDEISSYGIRIDWPTDQAPTPKLDSTKTTLIVDYNLSGNPVPCNTWVTITTQLVLQVPLLTMPWDPVRHNKVRFRGPSGNWWYVPSFEYGLQTPEVADFNVPHICGGYVIGSFDLFEDPYGTVLIGQYRFQRQYSHRQDPELHTFRLEEVEDPCQQPCWVGNFRFGHSYGHLDAKSLWEFDQWMTEDLGIQQLSYTEIPLDWEGQLPYPNPGEYIPPEEPSACGDPGTVFLPQDLNYDCYVDFYDFALFTLRWLECSDPNNPDCDIYWKAEPNLVAHWKLDEAVGTVALDSSGYGNHGILIGDPCWVTGRVSGAILFDGDGDYVYCSNSPSFDITNQITVAAWVNITTVPVHWASIATKGDSAWRISTFEGQRKFHFALTGPPDYARVDGSTEVSAGEWHHVVGTYDGANIRLYVDGVEDPNSPQSYSGLISTNNYNVCIGENSEMPGRYWNGHIDDVRIYNRALSAEEVRTLFDSCQ